LFAVLGVLPCMVVLLGLVGCDGKVGGTSEELTLPQQIDIAERELDPKVRAEKLLKLSGDQRQIKDLAGAIQTTEKALEAARAVSDPAVKTQMLVAVADEFVVLGRTAQAREAAGDAELTAVSISDRQTQLELEAKIVVLMWRTGDADRAKMLMASIEKGVGEIEDPVRRIELAARLTATASASNNTAATEQHAAEIDAQAAKIADVPTRIKALTDAAGLLYRADLAGEARKRLDAAVVLARGLPDPATKADALLTIFEKLQDLRKSVPLVELIPDAKTAAAAVADEKTKAALAARLQTLLALPE
jgi:hypothetical protein